MLIKTGTITRFTFCALCVNNYYLRYTYWNKLSVDKMAEICSVELVQCITWECCDFNEKKILFFCLFDFVGFYWLKQQKNTSHVCLCVCHESVSQFKIVSIPWFISYRRQRCVFEVICPNYAYPELIDYLNCLELFSFGFYCIISLNFSRSLLLLLV